MLGFRLVRFSLQIDRGRLWLSAFDPYRPLVKECLAPSIDSVD